MPPTATLERSGSGADSAPGARGSLFTCLDGNISAQPPTPWRDPLDTSGLPPHVAPNRETAAALPAGYEARARSMRDCGHTIGAVRECPDCGDLTPVSHSCHGRTCDRCARFQAKRLRERLGADVGRCLRAIGGAPWEGDGRPAWQRRRRLALMTLSMRVPVDVEPTPQILAERVERMLSVGSRFWLRSSWGSRRDVQVSGVRRQKRRRDTFALRALEVGQAHGMVHLHYLLYGEYVPQAELREALADVAGVELADVGVDIRAIPQRAGVRYVVSYLSKGTGALTPSRRAALEVALYRRRRVEKLGAIRGSTPAVLAGWACHGCGSCAAPIWHTRAAVTERSNTPERNWEHLLLLEPPRAPPRPFGRAPSLATVH